MSLDDWTIHYPGVRALLQTPEDVIQYHPEGDEAAESTPAEESMSVAESIYLALVDADLRLLVLPDAHLCRLAGPAAVEQLLRERGFVCDAQGHLLHLGRWHDPGRNCTIYSQRVPKRQEHGRDATTDNPEDAGRVHQTTGNNETVTFPPNITIYMPITSEDQSIREEASVALPTNGDLTCTIRSRWTQD